MKKLLLLLAILSISYVNAQAFRGKGDSKLQIGANLQDAASGVYLSYDYGLGENISIGVGSTYALGIKKDLNADFGDRYNIMARFNAHLGSVIGIDENFDIYPGLNLGLKNFGGHVGARYFFSEGFGVFTEALFPIAKYDTTLEPAQHIHNQFTVNLGAVFNL